MMIYLLIMEKEHSKKSNAITETSSKAIHQRSFQKLSDDPTGLFLMGTGGFLGIFFNLSSFMILWFSVFQPSP